MPNADAPHPRRRAIAQLTTLLAQAEETANRYRLAMHQQAQNRTALGPVGALLRMAEERVALLRQSRDRVLADAGADLQRKKKRSSRYDTS